MLSPGVIALEQYENGMTTKKEKKQNNIYSAVIFCGIFWKII